MRFHHVLLVQALAQSVTAVACRSHAWHALTPCFASTGTACPINPPSLLFLFFAPVCSYDRARSTDKFLEFLKEKLEADKGFARIEALDALAKKFVAEGADTAAILADTKAAVKKLEEAEQKNGKLYELFMERAIAKVRLNC